MRRRKRKRHRFIHFLLLMTTVLALAYGGTIGYVCILEGKADKELTPEMQYDAIVVLGAQVKEDGTPSIQLAWRLDAAAEAYATKKVPVVVCGAQGTDEPLPESAVMKRELIIRGVDEQAILEDPDSFNTYENLENAQKLLGNYPEVKRILIVTSDYHLPRSMAIARDLGFEAEGLGSPCKKEYWLKNHTREALAWIKYWGKKYLKLPL